MIATSPLKFSTPQGLARYPNMVIAGAAGVGKSAFLAGVGKSAKVLIADPEQGSTTYQSAWFQAQETSPPLDNIHIIGFDGVENVNDLVHQVEGTLDYLIRTKNSDGYALFALDSITEFQELFIKMHGASDPRQSYGALKEAIHGITVKARQAPIITIFTARLRSVEDPITQREMVRPEVSPGVWSVTSGLFDQIGLFDLKVQGVTSRRVLDFSPRPRFAGKDRFGLGELPDPTFATLQARLDGVAPATPTVRPAPRPVAPAARR